MDRETLLKCTEVALEFERRAKEAPLYYISWLPPQIEFFKEPHKVKMYRAGSQVMGKTWAGLGDVIFRCLGKHPYRTVREPPIECWIVCVTAKQSVQIQKKFYELVPKSELDPSVRFNPTTGFVGTNKNVQFKNGSVVRFFTSNQNSSAFSSGSIELILFDEPPASQDVFDEGRKRIQSKRGQCLLTLTPLNLDCEWLRKICDSDPNVAQPVVRDLHFETKAEYLIPEGFTKPITFSDGESEPVPCDQAWIDQITYGERKAATRVHGHWDDQLENTFFSECFIHSKHVFNQFPYSEEPVYKLGIDFGTGQKNSQYAVLAGVLPSKLCKNCSAKIPKPRRLCIKCRPETIWIFDESASKVQTTQAQDATAILDMLERNNLEWGDLKMAFADRDHMAKHETMKKGISDISKHLANQLNYRRETLTPKILSAKRGKKHGAGSKQVGEDWLIDALLEDRVFIDRRCKVMIEALMKYDGNKYSDHKHPIDALRYCLDEEIHHKPKGTAFFNLRAQ